MYQIQWRDKALLSVERIGACIAENNPTAANRVSKRIFEAVKLTASFPEMFPLRGKYRVCPLVTPYLIFYRVLAHERLIVVVDVIHAAQNQQPE